MSEQAPVCVAIRTRDGYIISYDPVEFIQGSSLAEAIGQLINLGYKLAPVTVPTDDGCVLLLHRK